ncbi:acetyltransferase [Candidatus Pelagibacter sp.]|nr:acetyltransferase [Candidatus Pelagibacter sp.]
MKKIAIIGASGHGKVIGEIALLDQYNTIDFFDDQISQFKDFPFTVQGNLIDLKNKIKNYDAFFVAIGDNKIRHDKISWLREEKVKIVNLIHPKSTISKFSSLGLGTCVMANAVINPGTLIKDGVIINTSASIDHDCIIEDFSHISPNCSLSGNVNVGKFSHLGTGTSVHPGINVGQNVKTGVGSKIYKDILNNKIYKN